MAERTSSPSSNWTKSTGPYAVTSTVLGTVYLPIGLPPKSIQIETRAVSATEFSVIVAGLAKRFPIKSNGYGEWERQVGSA